MIDGTPQVQDQGGSDNADTGATEADKKGEPNFASLTDPAEIVLAHNEMTRTAVALGLKAEPVEGFKSVAEGVRACQDLFASIRKRQSEQLARANKKTPAKKKGTSVKTPAKKTAAKKVAAPKKAAAASAASAKKTTGRAGDDTAIITWKGRGAEGDNPSKEGSGRFERIDRLRRHAGKTVAAFLKAGGKRATLSWCVTHKLVTLKPA